MMSDFQCNFRITTGEISMSRKPEKIPWWKQVLFVVGWCLVLSVFAALLIFIPPTETSITAIWVSVSHVVLGTAAMIIALWKREKWQWVGFPLMHSWMFILYATGLRALNAVYPIPMGWLLVFLLMYALAWLLPYLRPRLSSILLREQMAPETKWGKGCMSIALGGLPTIGSIAAVIGLHASRSGEENAVYLIMGIIGILTALAGSQAFSHQFWEQTRKMKSPDQEAEA
jgi:hypothetical protein